VGLYEEAKRLIELRQIGSLLSTLHTARSSPREEDLEEFYLASIRLLSEALSKNPWRAKQFLERLIDKAYRTIDRGGVKIIGGSISLASWPRFEKILGLLDKREMSSYAKTLKAISLYALYPKYRRVPSMRCSVRKLDGIMKLLQCLTSGRRCLEAYEELKEYNTIFTLRSALQAARIELDESIAKEAFKRLHLGTPADRAELYILLAEISRDQVEKAKEELKALEEYCSRDYTGKIHRAIDYSRTCTRIPRLRERLLGIFSR